MDTILSINSLKSKRNILSCKDKIHIYVCEKSWRKCRLFFVWFYILFSMRYTFTWMPKQQQFTQEEYGVLTYILKSISTHKRLLIWNLIIYTQKDSSKTPRGDFRYRVFWQVCHSIFSFFSQLICSRCTIFRLFQHQIPK